MRILFLCSSLEPGRDGVGDYTRSLAGECARQGHSCGIIALNDHFITELMESTQNAEREKIPFLRLPAKLTWEQRTPLIAAFRSHFRPDWISLQFVPYGFDSKGIVWNLSRVFRTLAQGHPLHLMFHELWIGDAAVPPPLRQRLVGMLQRWGIARMVSLLKPRLVTTSTPAFITMLKSLGTQAKPLPIFGSIPIASMDSQPSLPAELTDAGFSQDKQDRDQWLVGTFFGALYSEWKPEPLMGILKRVAARTGKRLCLLLAGRSGAGGEVIWQNLKQDYAADAVFVKFGEQPVEKISALLQIADFGIATSPWQLVGKSSAIAAMLDHGLPVIVTRDDFQPRLLPDAPPSTDPLLHRCDASLESKLATGLPKRPAHLHLVEIATRFCEHLRAASDASP